MTPLPVLTPARRRLAVELGLVLAVMVGAYLLGANYHQAFRATGQKEDFGQHMYAAAVAWTCGHGFSDIGVDAIAGVIPPELDQFLKLKRDTFDCSLLPPRIPHIEPNMTQGLYRYLMSVVAGVWTIRGVSWAVLSPLFGVVYACTMAAAYGLFRLGMGRVVALLMTVVLGISATNLGYLPALRDFSKAPFILGLILIMALIAKPPFERRRALWLSAGFGVILGIGFGFRNDLLINIVPWALVVMLCTPVRWRDGLRLKAACLATSAIVFVVMAAPILAAYGRGSNTGHVALLGVMTPFNEPLNVAGSVYQFGYGYSDTLAATMVTSYGERIKGQDILYLSPEYDAAAVEYFFTVVRKWPADMAIRAYGSVLGVLRFPFQIGVNVNAIPQGFDTPPWRGVYAWQQGLLKLLAGSGPYLVAAALTLIAAVSLRAAVILLLFVLYFTGYPAIQFHIRHFFHLEFITWWALGYLLQRFVSAARKPSAVFTVPQLRSAIRPMAAFAVLAVFLIAGPLTVLRAYQDRSVRNLIAESYLGAARETLATEPVPAGDGRTFLTLPTAWQDRDPSKPVGLVYAVAEFSSANCPVDRLSAAFRSQVFGEPDYSYVVEVKVLPGGAPTVVFFPGYRANNWGEFRGIELQTSETGCLARVSRVAPGKVPPIPLELNLTPAWRDATLHQTLKSVESSSDGVGPLSLHASYPAKLPWPRFDHLQPVTVHPQVLAAGSVVTAHNSGWRIQGRPESAYGYLVWFQTVAVPAGATFVVEGELSKSGLTVGLLRDNRWAGTVNVVTRGPFVASVAVPEAGEYALVIANYSKLRWAEEYMPDAKSWLPGVLTRSFPVDAEIRRAGWIRASDR